MNEGRVIFADGIEVKSNYISGPELGSNWQKTIAVTEEMARQVGFAGPPGRKATEALSKYILVDMFAKAIQGMRAEDAVSWASGEMKKIYGA